MNLNSFIKWQAEKLGRSVSIKIDKKMFNDEQEVSIWVYDYTLLQGQYVSCVEEIDLEGEKETRDRAHFEKLKKIYGNDPKTG